MIHYESVDFMKLHIFNIRKTDAIIAIHAQMKLKKKTRHGYNNCKSSKKNTSMAMMACI